MEPYQTAYLQGGEVRIEYHNIHAEFIGGQVGQSETTVDRRQELHQTSVTVMMTAAGFLFSLTEEPDRRRRESP